jgi:hypothetical protein
MSKAWMLALLLCVCVIPLAETQEHTSDPSDSGNAFLSLCGNMPDLSPKQSLFQQGQCLGYVVGIDDGWRIAYDMQSQSQPYCAPDGVTNGQLMRVLIKFIKDHPEKAHFQTRVLEVESFMDAFPCKAQSKKK